MSTVADEVAVARPALRVWRFEVRPIEGELDPLGDATRKAAQDAMGDVAAVRTARVYLIEAAMDEAQAHRIGGELLADGVSQRVTLGHEPVSAGTQLVEVHYKPGVMDPVAQSTQAAVLEMLPELAEARVRTGVRYDFAGDIDAAALRGFAETRLANAVVQDLHFEPFSPSEFAHGHRYEFKLTHVPMRELDDDGLKKLSREAHLFLSVEEMRAVRDYYRSVDREPTDIELETLAQTWSEHCVHKTLKSTVRYEGDDLNFRGRPNHEVHDDGTVTIHNLLKSTVAAATFELMKDPELGDWCVSVFEDNAGIVKFDDDLGVCIKVETHNHPSALEPYGGAATGIGGCIRDVMGTGLSAMPIANTDTFAVAPPEAPEAAEATNKLPKGVIDPRRILQQVVAGVRDYGNRMGIPTVNGAVVFHPDFLGNPLVFAGCVGLIPLDKCFGDAKPGDRIIALGGATGRDGIHGATFSSAELTDTHADEFSHAVQIGNPITQKQMMDVILQARDPKNEDGTIGKPLFSAITDCGAGGFSSAIGEMGEKVGANVELAHAPLKYAGLSYTEIWISEAQERMVLAVPPEHVDELKALCDAEDVSFCDLGHFGETSGGTSGGDAQLVLNYEGQRVGQLAMKLLHDGIPTPTREAKWSPALYRKSSTSAAKARPQAPAAVGEVLTALLQHPNIASKHWIIRQYDHEVQGSSVVKPLVGPQQDGPSDASVIRPRLDSRRGVALGCGLAPSLSEKSLETGVSRDGDSYWATLAAIDEAVRNVVCVGANPKRTAILDNFCWPSCDDPRNLGSLVRAAEACYDGALAYRTPFVSGKDSLNNQFTTEAGEVITIPPTLLVTAMAMVDDVRRCRTMDAKAAGNALLLVGRTTHNLGGSHYRMLFADETRDASVPHVDLKLGPQIATAVAKLIAEGRVASAHDCSDGGLLVAAAEMAFAGRVGLDLTLDLAQLPSDRQLDLVTALFAESPSRYLLEVAPEHIDATFRALRDAGAPFGQVGVFAEHDRLTLRSDRDGRVLDASLDALRQAWQAPLDW